MFFSSNQPEDRELRAFALGAAGLAGASPLLENKENTSIHVILSPAAGGFTRKERFRLLREELAALSPSCGNGGVSAVYVARYPGHPAALAAEIAERMLKEEAASETSKRHFLLTLGGDGTHLEVLASFLELPENVLRRLTVFRLPLGTGNDGADADSLTSSAEVLAGKGSLAMTGAVRIQPRGLKPFYAFNIASLGIDAFVTGLTNKFKKVLPGDVYKLLADAATIFYEPLYGVREMTVRLENPESEAAEIKGNFILLAFGVSGERSYGDHKWVLPGKENLCAIRTRSLRKKIALKPHLYAGTHGGLPGVELLRAERIVVDYPGKLPIQTDGEARLLEKENFPCVFEVLKPRIQVLRSGA